MSIDVKRNALRSLAALALLAGGCDWTTFDDLEKSAAVRVFSAPDNYRVTGYGNVVVSTRAKVGSIDQSSFVASAGADSPIVVEGVFENGELETSATVRCKKKSQCEKGVGVGATLIPFEVWGAKTPAPQHNCVLSPGTPNAYVFCQTNAGGTPNYALDVGDVKAPATNVKFGGAPLPKGHPLGIALVSAYAVSTRTSVPSNGTLFFHPDLENGDIPPRMRELVLVDPRTKQPFGGSEASGDFGYAVQAEPNNAGELVIAVAQPSQNRVIVATYDAKIALPPELMKADTPPSAQQSFRTRTRACLKSPDPKLVGFGKVLTMGDVNGDGEPDIVVGIDPTDGKNGTKQRLYLYDGAAMPAPEAAEDVCPLWDAEPVQVGCYDGVQGIACKDTQFGASVAIGDVDGDGIGDLLVGAPKADVQGVNEAGTVWIIPGSDDQALTKTAGLDFDAMTNLYATGLASKGHLGSSVAAVFSQDRDEPVAGAPGADRVYVFMCSSLETDVTPKKLCLPK